MPIRIPFQNGIINIRLYKVRDVYGTFFHIAADCNGKILEEVEYDSPVQLGYKLKIMFKKYNQKNIVTIRTNLRQLVKKFLKGFRRVK